MSPSTVRIKPLHGAPRKVWQLVHIVSAVGWLGIELCVLVLAVVGLSTDDLATRRTAYDAAVLLADVLFLPATMLMLVSGLVLGLGTRWGLLRYYWVAVKLAIGCALLVAGTATLENSVRGAAELADAGTLTEGEGISLVGMLAVVAGLTFVAAVLSVGKPWGRIPWRRDLAPQQRIQES
ncbi:hypothetical protein [Actinophytocola xanthii]|uniref:DUF2269 domain-containing protein n=1 Tax=Actinophytocola xanthii TaxID=1912961 RepID=A0A1Q8CSQ5_9PSEU|nr:hypothetical protein [Actinophytocola xanthii]OLF17395.1 hypothetical protein BU204_12220 [Actinophytocola xanthii]